MTEPRRWLETEDAPPDLLRLLRSGQPARPLDERARERSRRRLASLALPAAAGAIVWLQHAAYGALLGVAVTGSVTIAPRLLSTHASESPTLATRAASPRHARKPVSVVRPVDPAAPAPEAAAQPEPKTTARFDSPEHALAREARSLDHARAMVVTDPAAALSVLKRHRAEFPRGTLDVEREFLEVEALVRLGRRTEAQAVARDLRAKAPGSLYEGRLDRIMAREN